MTGGFLFQDTRPVRDTGPVDLAVAVRRYFELTGERPLPPMDVRGSFECCVACSITPEAQRCEGCPRPRTARVVYVEAPRPPRRRRRFFRRRHTSTEEN